MFVIEGPASIKEKSQEELTGFSGDDFL